MPHDLPLRPLSGFPVRIPAMTRWSDNDMYGHLNNAVYYELFDTAINAWLASHSHADFASNSVIGVVAESGCRFHSELAFPGPVTIGFRVEQLGRTSVVYQLAVFAGADPVPEALPSASGRWVHVYIDRGSKEKIPVPGELRSAMSAAS